MIKKILLSILTVLPTSIFPQEMKLDTSNTKPTVYLVGSIHHMHFDPESHYSIIDLLAQISALRPDLVCGEITPEAFNQPMEGYFPPEAAFLAEMASELNYRFVPADWRLDYATQAKADSEYPTSVKKARSALLNKIQATIKASDKQSMYDILHDSSMITNLDSLYEKIIGPNALAEIASGSWAERNRRAVENGLATAGNARIIVFVFGIDHLPGLQRQLKLAGFEAQIPDRLFAPASVLKVPDAVLERWKRNLDHLILIRDRKIPATYDSYQKVIQSKRIADLEEAIRISQ